jgi:hypothetical protein
MKCIGKRPTTVRVMVERYKQDYRGDMYVHHEGTWVEYWEYTVLADRHSLLNEEYDALHSELRALQNQYDALSCTHDELRTRMSWIENPDRMGK